MPKNKLSQLFVAVAFATATIGISAQQTPVPAFTFKKYIPRLLLNDSSTQPPIKKQPNLNFSAAEMAFSSTTVGTSSTQSILILNTGDGTADLTPGLSIREAGGVFSNLTTTCSNTLLPGASCSVSVTFTPTDSDSYQGHLDLRTANAGTSTILLGATGTGSAIASLATQPGYSNDYGLVEMGSSRTQSFTFSNTGNATDKGVYASVSGVGLGITANTCGQAGAPINLAKGSACNISVEYTPNSTAALVGQLVVNSSAATGVKSLNLTGRGGQAVLETSTNVINFSNVELGNSATESFILYNTGNSDASLTGLPSITAGSSSYFEDLSTNCGAVLPAGSNCAVSVKFRPTTVGTFSGSVEVSSTKGGTKTINLSGIGSGHAVAHLQPKAGSSSSFGDTAVGQFKTNYFTFTNTGNIEATGVFAEVTGDDVSIQSSTCGVVNGSVTIAKNASCEVAVKFAPTKVGSLTAGSVKVNSSATEGVSTLTLTGAGTGEPIASLAPSEGSSTNYGIVEIGQSKTQSFTYTNVGNIKDTGVYAYVSGSSDISVTNNTCGTNSAKVDINPNQSCSFTVTFAPSSKTAFVGTANIGSSATSGIKQLELTAVAGKANLEVSSAALDYSTVEVGSSKTLGLTVINTGNVTANIAPAVAFTVGSNSAFTNLTTSCGATLAVGATCTISADFVPSVVGVKSAQIDIKTNNANNVSVHLTGTGSGQPVGSLTPDTGSSTDFGLVEVGKNKSQNFVYKNTGNIPDTGVYVNLTGTALSTTSNNCGTSFSPVSIAAGQSCLVTVKYAPVDGTAFNGNLKIESAATSGVKSLSLQGVAGYAALDTSTASLAFNSVEVGSSSTLAFSIQNTGNIPAALTVPQIRAGSSSAYGGLTTNCGATLNTGATCNVNVTFTPSATGIASGIVDVGATNASSKTVTLSGTGSGQAVASLTLKAGYSADFGYVKVGSSAYTEFVFKNTGNIPANGVYPTITGTGLSLSNNNCGTAGLPVTLSPNSSCTVGVSFNPQNSNALVGAKITVNSSAASGTNFYNISGSGATAVASLNGPGSNFGNVLVGSYGQLSFSYQNTGNATASGVYAYATGSGVTVFATSCGTISAPVSLAPNGTCSIDVRYNPTSATTLSGASVGVSSDAVGGVSTVSLTGQGVQAQGSLTPGNGYTVNYGVVGVGTSSTQTYVFQNSGNTSATSTYAVLTGVDYVVSGNSCGTAGSTQTLAPGQSCSIIVTFTPTSATTKNATLSVYSSAVNSPSSLTLTGTGQSVTVTDYGSYKAWSNSTSAGSCNEYKNPAIGYSYSGGIGSGIYRIDTGGTGTLYVYCDMDTAGGGWTLVGRSGSGGPMGWYSSGGSVYGTGTYSLGVLNYNIGFNQILFGGGSTSPSNSVYPHAYYHNVSRATLLNYGGSMFYLDNPGGLTGNSSFRMAAYMGYTAYEGFFFRDCCGYAGYGLNATGWATAYGDGPNDIQGQPVGAYFGGYLNNRHGAIYVR